MARRKARHEFNPELPVPSFEEFKKENGHLYPTEKEAKAAYDIAVSEHAAANAPVEEDANAASNVTIEAEAVVAPKSSRRTSRNQVGSSSADGESAQPEGKE